MQHGKILRIFFGVRQKEEKCQLLEQIQKDFRDSAIDGILDVYKRQGTRFLMAVSV